MVGQLQWLITLGRFDIQAQVITMSRFRAQPRKGHLERLKRIYAYVIRTKDCATRFRTTEPDYSYLPDQNFDWAHTVHGHNLGFSCLTVTFPISVSLAKYIQYNIPLQCEFHCQKYFLYHLNSVLVGELLPTDAIRTTIMTTDDNITTMMTTDDNVQLIHPARVDLKLLRET